MTDNELLLKAAIHLQCALNNLDNIKNRSKYTRNLQKQIERFDKYMTKERELITNLYNVDEEMMLTLESAFNDKVNGLTEKEFNYFIEIV